MSFTTISRYLMLQLDFYIAFDHINWVATKEIMRAIYFVKRWIYWILHLVSTSQFTVLIYGLIGHGLITRAKCDS